MSADVRPPRLERDGVALLGGFDDLPETAYVLVLVRDPLQYGEGETLQGLLEATGVEDVRSVTTDGLFEAWHGTREGVGLLVAATASGGPETEVAIVELAEQANATTFIRVGTSGACSPDAHVGDLVIAAGAVRDDGVSDEWVLPSFPAVADLDVTAALAESARALDAKHHVGITRTTDSIFCGQGRAPRAYIQESHLDQLEYWRRAGVLNFERETATLLVLARLLGCRGGGVCSVVNSAWSGTVVPGAGFRAALEVSLQAVGRLAALDAARPRA
jgi:uridine phosphorylase